MNDIRNEPECLGSEHSDRSHSRKRDDRVARFRWSWKGDAMMDGFDLFLDRLAGCDWFLEEVNAFVWE